MRQKITPFLWFNDQAEEAAKFYTSIFKRSKILNVTHYGREGGKASGKPKGSVLTVTFEIAGQKFIALNGGLQFRFNQAVSFVVSCRTQKELNYFWKRLSAGGKEVQCGWLKDKFGMSWQIVPEVLQALLGDRDSAKSQRVMRALLKMVKLDIKALKQAYRGMDGRSKISKN